MKVQTVLRKAIVEIASFIPTGVRWQITRGLLESDGIGWGASTTHFEAKAASRILKELGVANPVAFDVGANIGDWSKAFLNHSPGALSYAFEPGAVTYTMLIENVRQEMNISPVNLGMSEKEGSAKLFTNAAGSGLASLNSRRLDHFNISMKEFEEIELSTIDNYIKKYQIFPSILKLDVEGHELSVLLGATQSISSIPLIQFEFGGCNLDSRTTFQDFWYFFTEHDFTIYRLGPRGISAVNAYSEECEIYMITNYFAVNKNYKPANFT
jgi:FkbM family methyltransferase